MTTPILIVDDDPDIRESLGDMLLHEGYAVQSVPDGSAALQRVRSERYGAALLDIQLPDLNGLSVLKVMMELDPDLPIIVLTGNATMENTVGSLAKGAFAYLTKPYNSQELKAILRRAVSMKGLVVRAEHVEQALQASEERFRALVESATDAIVLADQNGHIIWWNSAAERMFGYSKLEALVDGGKIPHPGRGANFVHPKFGRRRPQTARQHDRAGGAHENRTGVSAGVVLGLLAYEGGDLFQRHHPRHYPAETSRGIDHQTQPAHRPDSGQLR